MLNLEHSLPVQYQWQPEHLNAESLTRRYLQKRSASSTAPLTNIQNDIVYTVPLSLGTPAQSFNVIIDTGSPVTWVSSTTCMTGGCLRTKKFNCGASSTCQQSTTPFNVSYVSGQGVSGIYVAEQYTIGNLNFKGIAGIVVQNQASLPSTVDGLMGLWYSSKPSQIPILNILKNETALTQNVIGIWLQHSTSTTKQVNSPGGEISFGGVNNARFTGDITYIDCVASRPWSIPVGGITVGSQNIATNGAIAAIDTGTTAMLMPKTAADALNSAIPGAISAPNSQGLWFLPCSGNTKITISFGAFTATIPYTSLAMQTTRQQTSRGYYCQSAAMFPTGATVTIDEWLIGDVFLTSVYSVFDFDTNAATGGRIGFAQLNGASSGGSSGGSTDNGGSGSGQLPSAGTKGSSTMIKQATVLALFSILFAML
ncbi:hypothetical protein EDD11_002275 [Mortierella claussenii]|nr:hypothetical protein EDD11_002275 [Mortierella claussenii]